MATPYPCHRCASRHSKAGRAAPSSPLQPAARAPLLSALSEAACEAERSDKNCDTKIPHVDVQRPAVHIDVRCSTMKPTSLIGPELTDVMRKDHRARTVARNHPLPRRAGRLVGLASLKRGLSLSL